MEHRECADQRNYFIRIRSSKPAYNKQSVQQESQESFQKRANRFVEKRRDSGNRSEDTQFWINNLVIDFVESEGIVH